MMPVAGQHHADPSHGLARRLSGHVLGDCRGFTLVEALITLTISGVLATALISLLTGQSRFYNRTDEQMNAEQVSQATFDLLSTELRMAAPGDLLAASADSVTFRYDLIRAVVCDPTGGDEAAIQVYYRNVNSGISSSFVGVAVSQPYEEAYTYADSWNPTPSATGSGPKADCVAAGGAGTGSDSDYMRLSGWTSNVGAVPDRGAMVRGYSRLTYRIDGSSFFGSRWAIWRGTQELVGPFEAGAAFSYVMTDGSVQSSVVASDFADVRAVRLTATAVGTGTNPYGVSRPITFDVPFRN